MEQVPLETKLHNFTVSEFSKQLEEMIGTSDNAYKSSYGLNIAKRVKDYSDEQLKKIIESGTIEAQRELSYNYFSIDGMYRRIIIHYATLLTY